MRRFPFQFSVLLALLLFAPVLARAQNVTCTMSSTGVAFSGVDPLSSRTDVNGTVSYSCKNSAGSQRCPNKEKTEVPCGGRRLAAIYCRRSGGWLERDFASTIVAAKARRL